jgi:hypothetical protein
VSDQPTDDLPVSPKTRTHLTEIVTGLGMLEDALRATLPALPGEFRNVDTATWASVVAAWDSPVLAEVADAAFTNGRYFFEAVDALRGRRPRLVEWTGPRGAPGDEVTPVDLRIDHVFLVSCKYLSSITVNASPSHLFERLLTGGHGQRSADWFQAVAFDEYQQLWSQVCGENGLDDAIAPAERPKTERRQLAKRLGGTWSPTTSGLYQQLCSTVAQRSAERWSDALGDPKGAAAERMLWRLLRIGAAPYFVLGSHGNREPLRLRVASPWDWRQSYQLRNFRVTPNASGQAKVDWSAAVQRRADARILDVHGHVEIRWSHGRFAGPPEAKVYLDTSFTEIPGYWALS